MGKIDLRTLGEDSIVIHFGGELTSVDAYTFGNSLVSFADTIRAINETINPGQKIEIRLDAVGPGSFKAVIKKVKKGMGGLLSRAPENLLWAIVAVWIVDPTFEDERKIIVRDDHVEIIEGGDTIIITREAFDQYQNTQSNPNVRRGIQRTFQAIERDAGIENFGIAREITDEHPLVQVPRKDFARLASGEALPVDGGIRRKRNEVADVVVLKPWIDGSNKKWSFEWNGVPLSAYVRDDQFMELVATHQIRFGNGDVVTVEFEYFQDLDQERDVWINDMQSFLVVAVLAFLPRGGEPKDFS